MKQAAHGKDSPCEAGCAWFDFMTKVLESSVTFDNLNGIVKVAGHSVIVCARLSVWPLPVYARRLLIASNRHTAPHYFRCMAGIYSDPQRSAER